MAKKAAAKTAAKKSAKAGNSNNLIVSDKTAEVPKVNSKEWHQTHYFNGHSWEEVEPGYHESIGLKWDDVKGWTK